VAKVVRAGRRLIVVSAEVMSNDGKLAATALSTYIKL
jgi:acyl-coenzyme A thioesterase PaaI-like protein